jgi:hypothetical protein
MPRATADSLPDTFHHTTIALVRRKITDLSARQLAVFLTCYLKRSEKRRCVTSRVS